MTGHSATKDLPQIYGRTLSQGPDRRAALEHAREAEKLASVGYCHGVSKSDLEQVVDPNISRRQVIKQSEVSAFAHPSHGNISTAHGPTHAQLTRARVIIYTFPCANYICA